MADDSSTDRGRAGRKKLLAAVLLLIMFALIGRTAHFVWMEGDRLCQALQGELEHIPSAKMPCSKTSYLTGPIDWMTAASTGGSVTRSSVQYQFDDGELYRLDSDHGDDGTVDVTYRCSMLGKILMPLTNYAAWSSFSTFEEMARGGAPMSQRSTDDGGDGVPGLRTRLKLSGDPSQSGVLVMKASTYDEDARLHRQVVQGAMPGRLSIAEYEYDRGGNLHSMRQTFITHPYTLSRQTDYTYSCWD